MELNIYQNLERAELLIHQGNYKKAEEELNQALQKEPTNYFALYFLAVIQYEKGDFKNALNTIENSISQNPENSSSFYLKGQIYLKMDRIKEAEENAMKAIEIDNYHADYFALMSSIYMEKRNYDEAVNWASKGLAVDPANLPCLNLRSAALTQSGNSEEAFKTIETALNEDPGNPFTHANYGWGKIHQGKHKEALGHFREALRNDPQNEYAKAGLVEALKARSPLYSLYLRYATWMSRQKGSTQWIVIIGFLILTRLLRSAADTNPQLHAILIPVVVVFVLIAFSTWIISPIHDLILFLNPYGKYALSQKERLSASLVGIALGISALSVITYFTLSMNAFLVLSALAFTITIPLGNMFTPPKEKRQRIVIFYTIALAVVGILAVMSTFASGEIFNLFSVIYILGLVIFQWTFNFLVIK